MNDRDVISFEEFSALSEDEAYERLMNAANLIDAKNEQIVNMTNEYQNLLNLSKKVADELNRLGMCERCEQGKAVRYFLVADVAADLCNGCRTEFGRFIMKDDLFQKFRICTIRSNAAEAIGNGGNAVYWFEQQAKQHSALVDRILEWVNTPPDENKA